MCLCERKRVYYVYIRVQRRRAHVCVYIECERNITIQKEKAGERELRSHGARNLDGNYSQLVWNVICTFVYLIALSAVFLCPSLASAEGERWWKRNRRKRTLARKRNMPSIMPPSAREPRHFRAYAQLARNDQWVVPSFFFLLIFFYIYIRRLPVITPRALFARTYIRVACV